MLPIAHAARNSWPRGADGSAYCSHVSSVFRLTPGQALLNVVPCIVALDIADIAGARKIDASEGPR